MIVAKIPTGELVAVAYAKAVLSLAGLQAVPVATTLPDATEWAATGAVQVSGVVGGTPHENPLRDMIIGYDGWAVRPNSGKPPWGQANSLLELIHESAFWDWADTALPLQLEPAGVYDPVLVQGATPQTYPRRLADPDTSRAHYTMDFRLLWTVAAA